MATTTVFDIVLFGGCGDLSLRKLMPALYRGYAEGSFDSNSRIIPTCRDAETAAGYAEILAKSLQQFLSSDEYDSAVADSFMQLVMPCALDITTVDERWKSLHKLFSKDAEQSRIFYMAVPPAIFGITCENLSQQKMINGQSRIVVEKPIGYDGVTASAINDEIARYFDEKSIFRIDHYLGKETVQNLMALRFTNVIFEQLWDAKSIDHVQISISETVGLEGRAGFYDNAGALRDMVQNHLLQLLCLVAMESPNKLDANSIRAEKLKVLEALRPLTGADVDDYTVRGQYVAGEFNGDLVPGYLEELGKPSSNTETFVAIKAHIDNWRWSKVPFYLSTGKRMKARSAKIVIQFKEVSHRVYDGSVGQMTPNQLIIKLQPGESIQLSLMTKDLTCLETKLKPVSLNLNFSDTYDNFKSDAYKRLILDVAANNPALFIHRDEVDCAWRWIDPIIEQWQQSAHTPDLYRAGSWGPSAAKTLIEQDDRYWFNGESDQ
ncbi:Glucose-6-phosphate 1-dehydrogenase [Sinobacterium norvegicum]|uniref:Glucose-6-phosphate 1-dehydrogenase n=1 Tax=Sinobacterium norvegicum TaxID=1641715 RepID=A0ABN8EI99_9GAMM|nr:glucose-6-phosphate dehydrogenase [Sinobacterium norvegicum]CAH0990915.1 Glucose-6-phosphate 1-dehydrogenase [Sinobacterium norvegicum]